MRSAVAIEISLSTATSQNHKREYAADDEYRQRTALLMPADLLRYEYQQKVLQLEDVEQ